MNAPRTYPWKSAAASAQPAPRQNRRLFRPVLHLCLVTAILLTAVLWLVPGLPHGGYHAAKTQSDVALIFLLAAGLLIILTVCRILLIRRASGKTMKAAILIYGSLGLTVVFLLVFMLLLIRLLSTNQLYALSPQSPVESVYLLLGAVGVSAILLLKFVVKLDQLKRVPNA